MNCTVRQTTGFLQFPTLSERDDSASLGMWHVWTLNMISIGSLGRRSDHPVIGGDFVDAVVPAGWLGATDRPTDVRSVNIGIQSAWRKPSDRALWRRIVDTANTLLEKNKVRHLQVAR